VLQLQGALPPDSLNRGPAPGPRYELCPQTSIIGSRYRARRRAGPVPPPQILLLADAPCNLVSSCAYAISSPGNDSFWSRLMFYCSFFLFRHDISERRLPIVMKF